MERDEMTCHHCGNGDHFARECDEPTANIPAESMQQLVYGHRDDKPENKESN